VGKEDPVSKITRAKRPEVWLKQKSAGICRHEVLNSSSIPSKREKKISNF
jgi:hypothetical protein